MTGRKFYRFKKIPYMPVEFSAAAYRLGHSMVRQRYRTTGVQRAAGLQPVLHVHRPVGRHRRRPRAEPADGRLPCDAAVSNWIIDWRRFYELGPAGGAAVTAQRRRASSIRYLVAVAAQPAGRRRQSRVPQSQARRQPRPAFGSGRRQAHEGQEPADAGRDRVRQRRLDRRRRRQAAGPAYRRRRSGTTSSRKPRSGTTASASDRSARPSSRKCSSASCTATTIPSCGGSRTGSRRCRRRRRATFTMVDLLRFVDDINPLGD